MKTVSQIFGKQVINIYEGVIEGYVNNISLSKNLKKLHYIVFFDDNTQEEKIIDCKYIYHIGKDAILLKNSEHILLNSTMIDKINNPLSKHIFSFCGDSLSVVKDIQIDTNYNVEKIISDTTEYLPSDLIRSNDLLFMQDKMIKISQFSPKRKKIIKLNGNNISVQIQEINKTKNNIIPTKALANNNNFLIGRKINCNLYSDDKHLIIKKQNKITSQVLAEASRCGKLQELASNTII